MDEGDLLQTQALCLRQIEPVEVHHFGPSGHKVFDKLSLGVIGGLNLGNAPKLRVGAKGQIDPAASPFYLASFAITTFVEVFAHF